MSAARHGGHGASSGPTAAAAAPCTTLSPTSTSNFHEEKSEEEKRNKEQYQQNVVTAPRANDERERENEKKSMSIENGCTVRRSTARRAATEMQGTIAKPSGSLRHLTPQSRCDSTPGRSTSSGRADLPEQTGWTRDHLKNASEVYDEKCSASVGHLNPHSPRKNNENQEETNENKQNEIEEEDVLSMRVKMNNGSVEENSVRNECGDQRDLAPFAGSSLESGRLAAKQVARAATFEKPNAFRIKVQAINVMNGQLHEPHLAQHGQRGLQPVQQGGSSSSAAAAAQDEEPAAEAPDAEEARQPKKARDPGDPTRAEWEAHQATH